MIGDIVDYNKSRAYIVSGEKRRTIDFESEQEYQYWIANGMSFSSRGVIFDYENKKIIKFLQ